VGHGVGSDNQLLTPARTVGGSPPALSNDSVRHEDGQSASGEKQKDCRVAGSLWYRGADEGIPPRPC
jgi:hypothetical protein